MDSELFSKVVKGIKGVGRIEALLLLPMAALNLAIVVRSVGADELEFRLCMLSGMIVGLPGLAGQRFYRSVPAGFPEIDV